MAEFDKLGISYKGDYIKQGSMFDKCQKSSKLGIKYTEIYIRKDGKEFDANEIKDSNLIFHLPTLSYDLSNMKKINEFVTELLKNNINKVIIDASNLPLDVFDWSTINEQQEYIKALAGGLSSIASNNITVLIENTKEENNVSYFGQKLENISDLLMYTRSLLLKNYDLPKEKANELVGVVLNASKLYNNLTEIKNFVTVFKEDIKVLKVSKIDNMISIFENILNLFKDNNLNPLILLETDNELEEITKEYRKFEYLVNCKKIDKTMNLSEYTDIVNSKYDEYDYDFSTTSQSGFTNIVIILMIIITLSIAGIMIYLKLK